MAETAHATRRRLRRRRWIIIAAAALVCLWAAVQILKIIFAVVSPDVDYAARIVESVAARQPDGDENAWPIYREAFAACRDVAHNHAQEIGRREAERGSAPAYSDASRLLFGPPDPDRWRLEAEELRRLEECGVFALLERAASIGRAVSAAPHPDPEFGNVMVFGLLDADLGGARHAFDALACRMRLAFLAGDWEAHARALDAGLAAARALATQGVAVQHRAALRGMTTLLDELQYELTEGPIDADTLSRLSTILAARADWLDGYDLVVEVDRLVMLDAVQRWYTDHGFGVGFAALSRIPGMAASSMAGVSEVTPAGEPSLLDRLANLRSVSMPTRRRTARSIEEWSQALRGIDDAPPHRRLDELNRIEQAFQPLLAGNEVLSLMVSSDHEKGLAEALEAIRRIRVVRIMLAIERHARAHGGALPRSLDDLVDLDDPALLIDPLAGGRFLYLHDAGESSQEGKQRRPYLLFPASNEERQDQREALNVLRPD